MIRLAAALLAAILLAAPAAAQVVDLPVRPGVTVRVLLALPSGPPRALALLLTGGRGVANIPDRPGPGWARNGNFLVRSRGLFRERGVAAAVVDAPSDRRDGLGAWRLSAEHADDLAAVAAALRGRAGGAPVWLVGTSAGTLSAASAAAQLPPGTIDGVVLTAAVTRGGRPTNDLAGRSLGDVDLARIRMPVLLVHHRDDACVSSPFAGVAALRVRLAAALRVEVVALSGGHPPRSAPCDALSPHGFLGIEDQAVDAIVAWIAPR